MQNIASGIPEVRLITDQRYAIHDPVRGTVVIGSVMLGAAVVPESDIVSLPGMADLEIR